VVHRLLQAIPSLLGISVVSFILLHSVPGTPAQVMLGEHYTAARAAALNHELGLDRPLVIQYLVWLNNLAHLNFGFSYAYDMPVSQLIAQNLPHTLVLVGLSIMFAHLFALILGTVQAYFQNSRFDHVATVINYFFYAMPSFWLGIVLIEVFAIDLGLLPSGGITDPALPVQTFGSYLAHLVLPAGALAITSMAGWARYMRSAVIETQSQDFVRTARSKGLTEWRVVFVHVVRNSILPLITLFGLSLPGLFAGALVVEDVFNYPGMGLLFWNASLERDYPTLLAIIVMLGFLTIVGNLVADILYSLVDPRIQYG
jgi:peptide/nickel transport system permease protein